MRPLTVMNGRDFEALNLLVPMYGKENARILDATYNTGKMWKGAQFKPHRMDINGDLQLDTVGDFTAMPFPDGSFDLIVFDPPHLPVAAASAGSSGMWKKTYGITSSGEGREGDNVSGMFIPFLTEAKRVLSDGGVILAKIADLIHNHRYQWQQVDFVNSVKTVGMTPCDMLIKCDPQAGKLMSSKWNKIHHLRKAHCYWIVVRNSTRCE